MCIYTIYDLFIQIYFIEYFEKNCSILSFIRWYLGSQYPELGELNKNAIWLRRAEYAKFRTEYRRFKLSEGIKIIFSVIHTLLTHNTHTHKHVI